MANEIPITVVGNLTADPELRYTQSGLPVANVTIAQTPRKFDRQSGEWKDEETVFLRGSVWRELAEHVGASLTKGQQVIATGTLKQRTFEDREGQRRTAYEIDISEIAMSLRYGTATFTKSAKGQQNAPAVAPVAQQGASQQVVNAPQGQPVQQQAPQAQQQPVYAAPAGGAPTTMDDDSF